MKCVECEFYIDYFLLRKGFCTEHKKDVFPNDLCNKYLTKFEWCKIGENKWKKDVSIANGIEKNQ